MKKGFGFGIFLTAFLFGYFFVPVGLIPKSDEIQLETVSPPVQMEITPDLETIEEVNELLDDRLSKYKMGLLEIGEGFHGDEVPATNGDKWLGLFQDDENYVLRYTTLRIKRDYDPIVDGEDRQKKSGKSVDVVGQNKPLFLIKNAAMLREGRISTLFRGIDPTKLQELEKSGVNIRDPFTKLDRDFERDFMINGKTFWLRANEAKNKAGEKIWALTLEGNGIRQIVQTMNVTFAPELGVLYWVGDIDRDGRPDIFCSLYEHDNVENSVLFISSAADKGKLIKKVAQFWRTGC